MAEEKQGLYQGPRRDTYVAAAIVAIAIGGYLATQTPLISYIKSNVSSWSVSNYYQTHHRK